MQVLAESLAPLIAETVIHTSPASMQLDTETAPPSQHETARYPFVHPQDEAEEHEPIIYGPEVVIEADVREGITGMDGEY